jgi:tetratricopeptide (TPR) repeat protein
MLKRHIGEPAYHFLYAHVLIDQEKKWDHYTKCINANDRFFRCLIGRGKIYTNWKIWDRAAIDFQAARKLKPSSILPQAGLAGIALKRGQNVKAIRLYKALLSNAPNSRDVFEGLAKAYLNQKNTSQAIVWYKKLIGVEPGNFAALRALSVLYLQQRREREAMVYLARALKVRSKHFETLSKLAELKKVYNQFTDALSLYRRASVHPRAHVKIFATLGELEERAGNVANAIKAYRQAYQANKEDMKVITKLAGLYVQVNEPDRAAGVLKVALSLKPKSIPVRKKYADVLEKQGLYADVLKEYQTLLRYRPNDSDVQSRRDNLLRKIGLSLSPLKGSSLSSLFGRGKRQVFRCYRKRLKEKPKLKGKLALAVIINKDGSVRRVLINRAKSSLKDKLVEACVRWVFGRMQTRPRGSAYKVDFPLNFRNG